MCNSEKRSEQKEQMVDFCHGWGHYLLVKDLCKDCLESKWLSSQTVFFLPSSFVTIVSQAAYTHFF